MKVDKDIPLPRTKATPDNQWRDFLVMLQHGDSFVISKRNYAAITDAARVLKIRVVSRSIDNGNVRVWVKTTEVPLPGVERDVDIWPKHSGPR